MSHPFAVSKYPYLEEGDAGECSQGRNIILLILILILTHVDKRIVKLKKISGCLI
jgi:hypothetical protein